MTTPLPKKQLVQFEALRTSSSGVVSGASSFYLSMAARRDDARGDAQVRPLLRSVKDRDTTAMLDGNALNLEPGQDRTMLTNPYGKLPDTRTLGLAARLRGCGKAGTGDDDLEAPTNLRCRPWPRTRFLLGTKAERLILRSAPTARRSALTMLLWRVSARLKGAGPVTYVCLTAREKLGRAGEETESRRPAGSVRSRVGIRSVTESRADWCPRKTTPQGAFGGISQVKDPHGHNFNPVSGRGIGGFGSYAETDRRTVLRQRKGSQTRKAGELAWAASQKVPARGLVRFLLTSTSNFA
jgi:hypothetical protein